MNDRRRVVLVADSFPATSETFIVDRFVRLLERGWDMHVLCRESPRDQWAAFPELAALRIRARVHRRPAKPSRTAGLIALPLVLARSLIQAPMPTMRYLVTGWRLLGRDIFKALYYDRELVRLRPGIIHFTFGWFAPGREYLAAALDARLVVSFQGADLNYGGLEQDGYYDGVWRTADAIHFQGRDLERRAAARGFEPDGRASVVVPGIDVETFAPDPRERSDDQAFRIVSIGRLHWKKGYEYALQAVRSLIDAGIDCRYRIIGGGPARDATVFAIHDLRLVDHVELLGEQPATRVHEELQWADVLLHTATSEGFCYAVLEAQAMEVPVVTSDADGLPENVADGETGFVTPRRDAAAVALCLEKLARDPSLRRRMGAAGRARVSEHFGVDKEIAGFEALYRRAIDRHHG